jgi:hypothetical protein
METKSAELLYDNKIDNRLAESASRVIGKKDIDLIKA